MNNQGLSARFAKFSVLLKETGMLMVGVGSYTRYIEHMTSRHPEKPVLTEVEFFRYCQDSRYPGKSGSIKRCPC